MSRGSIPMPKGYQGTIWPLSDDDVQRLKDAFSKQRLKSNKGWWVPLGTEVVRVGDP